MGCSQGDDEAGVNTGHHTAGCQEVGGLERTVGKDRADTPEGVTKACLLRRPTGTTDALNCALTDSSPAKPTSRLMCLDTWPPGEVRRV